MKKKDVVLLVTNGLTKTAMNTVLWWFYLCGASIGKTTSPRDIYRMFQEADRALEDFNYDSFKQIISDLKKAGLIARKKQKTATETVITTEGMSRLDSFLPVYRQKRTWDGFIYLISYDIAEIHHRLRNRLRIHLKKLGCARIQESLWMSPYFIHDILDQFVKQNNLEGTILISRLGKDGAIGEETFEDFLIKAYRLDELNDRYKVFIKDTNEKRLTGFQISVKYYSILKNDPQLPFSLLPKDWQGNAAYKIFKEKIGN